MSRSQKSVLKELSLNVRDGYSSVTGTDDERAVLGSPVREGYLGQIRKLSRGENISARF